MRMHVRWLSLVAAAAGCGAPEGARPEGDEVAYLAAISDDAPGSGAPRAPAPPAPAAVDNGITYHGGPLLVGDRIAVYFIWYGDWSGDAGAQDLLATMVSSLTADDTTPAWYGITLGYTDKNGSAPASAVALAGVTTCADGDSCYVGEDLGANTSVRNVVQDRIRNGLLPSDPNGVYFVLGGPNVTQGTFCNGSCGWHGHGTIDGADIKYSFVGDASVQCPTKCQKQGTGPNGDGGGDAMASVLAHELTETVTDPDLNAWYDASHRENADKCAWTFGTTAKADNGALYNVTIAGLPFLIQQNWVNAGGGYCALE